MTVTPLTKGVLNSLICTHFCSCGHIDRFGKVDDVQCDCNNYFLHGDLDIWLTNRREDWEIIKQIIRKRAYNLMAYDELYPFSMHLYFDHDNKSDYNLGAKTRWGKYKAQEDILNYAKDLLRSYGFSFETVLGAADDQMRYNATIWKQNGRAVVSLSFDSDFAIFGLKTIRLDPQHKRNENGKNGIVGYIDLECVKITPEIKANKTLSNLLKVSKDRAKAAILYSLIDTFNEKPISINTVISIAAAQGYTAKFDRKLKKIQHHQELSFEVLKQKILDQAAEKYLCSIVYNPELGRKSWYDGVRFCHPVLAQSYIQFKKVPLGGLMDFKRKVGLKPWTEEYLKKVKKGEYQSFNKLHINRKLINSIKDTIRKGKAAELQVSTYKYDEIPSLDTTVHDKYLERIDKYKVRKDFSIGKQSTIYSIMTQKSVS